MSICLYEFLKTQFCFSGVAADGVLVVTATGMLGAFLIPAESPYSNQPVNTNPTLPPKAHGPFLLQAVTESLGHTRNYLTTADISYGKGKISGSNDSNT